MVLGLGRYDDDRSILRRPTGISAFQGELLTQSPHVTLIQEYLRPLLQPLYDRINWNALNTSYLEDRNFAQMYIFAAIFLVQLVQLVAVLQRIGVSGDQKVLHIAATLLHRPSH